MLLLMRFSIRMTLDVVYKLSPITLHTRVVCKDAVTLADAFTSTGSQLRT